MRLLLGGSPCTFWSIAKNIGRETKAEGFGWELFKNYLIAKELFKPDLFLYENNWSAAQEIKDQISMELKSPIQRINSNLVSAQNRDRFYCHNIPGVLLPDDCDVLIRDILDTPYKEKVESTERLKMKKNVLFNLYGGKSQNGAVFGWNGKSKTLSAGTGNKGSGVGSNNAPKILLPTDKRDGPKVFKIEGGKTLVKGVETNVNVVDGYYEVRSMSVSECARLQTMPFDYCKDVSNTQAYKCLGNGWTADIIIHILRQGLKDTPRHERIEVLSMYDGIGTAMYCLRQLGFENIVYTAYEIDINAIKVAKSNWPEIHEKGDAFQIREGGIYGL